MKRSSIIRVIFAGLGLPVLIISGGCNKEKEPASNSKPSAPANTQAIDSTYYLKGTFGSQPVKIEGNNVYYAGIDSTISTSYPGGSCNGEQRRQGNNGYQGHDHDQSSSVYVTGTKWVNTSTSGTQTTVASLELRSLDVRVYVAPTTQLQTQLYSMLKPATTYTLASASNPQQGAYITVLDQNGVRWSSIGDQTGSTFQIETVGGNPTGALYTTFTGVFSINVYDGNGNVKQLSNVTFSALAGL